MRGTQTSVLTSGPSALRSTRKANKLHGTSIMHKWAIVNRRGQIVRWMSPVPRTRPSPGGIGARFPEGAVLVQVPGV